MVGKAYRKLGGRARLPLASLLEVLAVGIVVGVLPLLLGFVPSYLMSEWKPQWSSFSAGLALGFLSLFLTDLIADSGGLGISAGLNFTLTQFGLAASFFLGFTLLFLFSTTADAGSSGSATPILIAYIVALGIGLHALGEGMIIGNNLAGQISIEDISTVLQGFSFVMHKFLEGFTVAVFFGPRPRIKSVMLCALFAGLPFLLGIPLGAFTYPAILANFFFAGGAGAVVYMMTQVPRFFQERRYRYRRVLGFLLGFVIVYFASLIHFTAGPDSS